MSTPPGEREVFLVQAFVRLADTLVNDYDVIDLFHGLCADCVSLLDADAAGLLLADPRGRLQVVSASDEQAHVVELFQIQSDQGPCLESFRTSAQVHVADLDTEDRWPRFTARARDNGFGAVHALPMRLRGQTVGALNLFHRRGVTMDEADLGVGQALADVATIAILTDRTSRQRELLAEQLQTALASRVVIEQAKGVLAERAGIALDDAFGRMRAQARARQQRLSDLARTVVDGTLDTSAMVHGRG
jgi:GAF domain-containing protein